MWQDLAKLVLGAALGATAISITDTSQPQYGSGQAAIIYTAPHKPTPMVASSSKNDEPVGFLRRPAADASNSFSFEESLARR